MVGGAIPAPIIAITINEEAIFVFLPRPVNPRAKIVGYCIERKKLLKTSK